MVVGLGVVSYLSVKKINDRFNELVELPIPSILRLSSMTEAFLLSIEEAHSYRLYGETEAKEDYETQKKEFDRLMTELKLELHYGTTDIPPEDTELIDTITEKITRLNALVDADFSQFEQNNDTVQSKSDPFSTEKEEVVKLLRSYRNLEKEEIKFAHSEVGTITFQVLEIILLVTGVFMVIIIIISGLLARSILKPLQLLKEAAEKLGQGDMSSRVTIHTKDELGVLAQTFNSMADNVKEARSVLEAKIQERTLELEKAKKGLEETVTLRTTELEKAKKGLGETVRARTQEIQNKLEELKKVNAVMVDRELKMVELKNEIVTLKQKLGVN